MFGDSAKVAEDFRLTKTAESGRTASFSWLKKEPGFTPVSPTLVEIGGPAGSVPDVNEVSRVSGLPVGQVMEAEPTDGGSDGVASADELQLGSGHGRHLSFPGHVAKEGEV